MQKKRVVITGQGVVSPVGTGVEKFWKSLIEGKSGIRPVTHFDVSKFDTRICGDVIDYNPLDYFNSKETRNLARFVQFASVASREAVKRARLDLTKVDLDRVGVLIGSGIGSIDTIEHEHQKFLERGPSKISPLCKNSPSRETLFPKYCLDHSPNSCCEIFIGIEIAFCAKSCFSFSMRSTFQ